MHNIEAFILPVIGLVLTANQATIDATADSISGRIVDAVKNSETKLDDVAAKEVARVLARIAANVEAGIATE